MRVLLLGGGGREHALGWRLSTSPRFGRLFSAPGNPGLAQLGDVAPDLDITDGSAVADHAASVGADLVVIGPEAPLAAGVVDELARRSIPAFGPTLAGARLESSKAYAKDIMLRAGVPTAAAATFSDEPSAVEHLRATPPPYVVKADGLAGGKGVLVTSDLIAAESWAKLCFGGHFGEAGRTVVIEEHLEGAEVSVFAVCDGERAVAMEPARDYKRLSDGDTGPNTGGMGCYSPVPDLDPGLVAATIDDVVRPVLRTLSAEGTVYRGFLYVGLMLTDEGPKVLEFNCRLGDPETQALMPRLTSDLLTILEEAAHGRLATRLEWRPDASVGVVLAAAGYPESPRRGDLIHGLEAVAALPDVHVFHAGTSVAEDGIRVGGGRVVNVVGLGPTIDDARRTAYDAAAGIDFHGRQLRRDIGLTTGGS